MEERKKKKQSYELISFKVTEGFFFSSRFHLTSDMGIERKLSNIKSHNSSKSLCGLIEMTNL